MRAVVLALLLVALTSCATPTPAASVAPVAEQPDPAVVFRASLKAADIAPNGVLVAQARQACELIGDGIDPHAVALALAANSDLSSYEAGYVIGVSVSAFCPQHRALLAG